MRSLVSNQTDIKDFHELKEVNRWLNQVKNVFNTSTQLEKNANDSLSGTLKNLDNIEHLVEQVLINLNNISVFKIHTYTLETGCNCAHLYKFLHKMHEPYECLFDIAIDSIHGFRHRLLKKCSHKSILFENSQKTSSL